MPPRAQKRKLSDSPYALSSLKRTIPSNGPYAHNSREPRDRDRDRDSSILPHSRDAYDGGSSAKRRKLEAGYYPTGVGRDARGEDGPLITLDLGTLPHTAIIKYLQTYGLLPPISPHPVSVQRPEAPHALLSPSRRSKPSFDDKPYNGSSSALGLTAHPDPNGNTDKPVVRVEEEERGHTALYDVDECKQLFTSLAQTHWNSVSSTRNLRADGVPLGTGPRISERDIIDDFFTGLRGKELSVRLSI